LAARSSTDCLAVRALEPTDINRLADLYERLTPRSRYLRFMAPIRLLPDAALGYLANIDHDRHEAVGAFDDSDLIGSAHWFRSQHHPRRADIAIEVADDYQRQGVGARLLRLLGRRAQPHGIDEFGATLFAENVGAIALLRSTGWTRTSTADGPELTVILKINEKN